MIIYLNQTIKVVHLVIETLLKSHSVIPSEDRNLKSFYFNILFKAIHTFEGCVYLIYQFPRKPFFQLSYQSGLRDVISDLINAEYINCKELDPGADMDLELAQFYNDHYINTDRVKTLNEKMFGSTSDYGTKELAFNKIGEHLRSENGKIKKSVKSNSIFSRIDYIYDNCESYQKEQIRKLYMAYLYSSKLAHFGELTIELIEKKYSNCEDQEFKIETKQTLEVVLLYCIGILAQISPTEDSQLTQQWNELRKMSFDAK